MPTSPLPSARTWSASEILSWTNPRSASYGLWGFSDFDEAANGLKCLRSRIEARCRAATKAFGVGLV